MPHRQLSSEEERIATIIVDAAITVHRALGPGLLESIYEVCLHHELSKRGLRCQRQVALPLIYDGIIFEEGLRLDLLAEDLVICELKATDEMHPVIWPKS